MDCPHCKTSLVMAQRQGVEIDHCPKCRGVWLDRGELDKIIERSNAYIGHGDEDDDDEHGGFGFGDRRPAPPPTPSHHPQQTYPHPHEPRRRKSFWSELFD